MTQLTNCTTTLRCKGLHLFGLIITTRHQLENCDVIITPNKSTKVYELGLECYYD